MLKGYYQKTKEDFQKRLVKGVKIFLKEKKAKSLNMLVSDVEIFLKKKKKRSVNMVVNDIKTLLKDEKLIYNTKMVPFLIFIVCLRLLHKISFLKFFIL